MRELTLSVVAAQRRGSAGKDVMSPEELVERVRGSEWGVERAGDVLFEVGTLSVSSVRHDRVAIDANDAGGVKLEARMAGLGCATGVVTRDGWLEKLQVGNPAEIQTASRDSDPSGIERFRADKLKGVATVREPLSEVVYITWIACYNDGVLVSILGGRSEMTGDTETAKRRWAVRLTDGKGTDYRPVELLDTYHQGESIRECVGFSPGIPRDVSALKIRDGNGVELLVPLIN